MDGLGGCKEHSYIPAVMAVGSYIEWAIGYWQSVSLYLCLLFCSFFALCPGLPFYELAFLYTKYSVRNALRMSRQGIPIIAQWLHYNALSLVRVQKSRYCEYIRSCQCLYHR